MREMPTAEQLDQMSVDELQGLIHEYDAEVGRVRGNMRVIQAVLQPKAAAEHAKTAGDPALAQSIDLHKFKG